MIGSQHSLKEKSAIVQGILRNEKDKPFVRWFLMTRTSTSCLALVESSFLLITILSSIFIFSLTLFTIRLTYLSWQNIKMSFPRFQAAFIMTAKKKSLLFTSLQSLLTHLAFRWMSLENWDYVRQTPKAHDILQLQCYWQHLYDLVNTTYTEPLLAVIIEQIAWAQVNHKVSEYPPNRWPGTCGTINHVHWGPGWLIAEAHSSIVNTDPLVDGWFISDFYAFNYLLKGLRHGTKVAYSSWSR